MKARFAVALAVATLFLVAPRIASAFCGFYVSGADAKLFADATQVVMMREGTRTVLAMQNDYQGPAADFAMVVPVPVVLQKENVKTLPKAIFEKVDALSAPRLVEYWEQDPCPMPGDRGGLPGLGGIKGGGGGGLGSIGGAGAARSTVKIEAQFEVGEYEILILSAKDSGGLDAWLREHGYKIPENAEPALRPYVQAGSKFFVAKVDVTKVKFEGGRAQLSPLRFYYDSETFALPVRLGMLNSSGTQDLIVQILAPKGERYEVTNYPNVTIPTNLDVAESARKSFPAFYAALLDKTLEKTPGAVVTEYSWGANSCDPCPGKVQGLTMDDLATLGADVLPSAKIGPLGSTDSGGPKGIAMLGTFKITGALDANEVTRIGMGMRPRLRACYQVGLNSDPAMAGLLTMKIEVDSSGAVTDASVTANTGLSPAVAACAAGVFKRSQFSATRGSAVVPITFSLQVDPSALPVPSLKDASAPPVGLLGIGPDFVLTRLHARYARGSLANDLVFKAASKIVGGREFRQKGELETGAQPSDNNAFQARYAIRHTWSGPVKCEKPERGIWGGPWIDAGTESHEPVAATKLAYAPRGGVTLASFLPNGVPELAVVGAVPPTSDTTAPADRPVPNSSPRASRCGCEVIGGGGGDGSVAAGLAAIALAISARRRRGPVCRTPGAPRRARDGAV